MIRDLSIDDFIEYLKQYREENGGSGKVFVSVGATGFSHVIRFIPLVNGNLLISNIDSLKYEE